MIAITDFQYALVCFAVVFILAAAALVLALKFVGKTDDNENPFGGEVAESDAGKVESTVHYDAAVGNHTARSIPVEAVAASGTTSAAGLATRACKTMPSPPIKLPKITAEDRREWTSL